MNGLQAASQSEEGESGRAGESKREAAKEERGDGETKKVKKVSETGGGGWAIIPGYYGSETFNAAAQLGLVNFSKVASTGDVCRPTAPSDLAPMQDQ